MTAQTVTLIFWVDGRPDPEKVFETSAPAVPRIGDQVQLGAYGGPYEWRRVTDLTWRHNVEVRGGVSAMVTLSSQPLAQAERDPGGDKGRGERTTDAPTRAVKSGKAERQPRLPET